MKKTITISWDEDKLSALRMYLGRKNTTPEKELTVVLEMLYLKAVPSNVRQFLDMRDTEQKSNRKKKNSRAEENTAAVAGEES